MPNSFSTVVEEIDFFVTIKGSSSKTESKDKGQERKGTFDTTAWVFFRVPEEIEREIKSRPKDLNPKY